MARLRRLAALLLLALGAASSARAACGGRDLLAEVRRSDPAAFSALEAEAARVRFGRGLLFEITRPGLPPSYLFGTVHLHDPRSATLPPAAAGALAGASTVALELAEGDVLNDPKALERLGPGLLKSLTAKPAERASRLLPPESLARLREALAAYGLPADSAEVLKPAFLAVLFSIPPCATAREGEAKPGVDDTIARLARERSIPIQGLESIEEQLDALTLVPPARQRQALVAALQALPHAEDVLETTLARYVAGEMGLLMAALRRNADALGVRAAYEESMNRLVVRRNLVMRRRALPLLARGGAFIAVGALHLPGEQGLARLFEQAGYRVRVVEER